MQVEHEFYQFPVNVVFVIWAKLFESQVVSFAGAAVWRSLNLLSLLSCLNKAILQPDHGFVFGNVNHNP